MKSSSLRAGSITSAIVALAASALPLSQASANVITYFTTVYNTDWTTAGPIARARNSRWLHPRSRPKRSCTADV